MALLTASKNRRWPGGVMPFTINRIAFPPGSDGESKVLEAIRHINTSGCLFLVERDKEKSYVAFEHADASCSSPIGRQGNKKQAIGCDLNSPDASVGNVIHEILHAAGFHHEHQRDDRDTQVTYYPKNVRSPDLRRQFNILKNAKKIGYYDHLSIMHYKRTTFARRNSQGKLLETLRPDPPVPIGQRTSMSAGDRMALWHAFVESFGVHSNKDVVLYTHTTRFAVLNDGSLPTTLSWPGQGDAFILSDLWANSIKPIPDRDKLENELQTLRSRMKDLEEQLKRQK